MRDLSFLTGGSGQEVRKVVTGFDRHDVNVAKAGAYYTDLAHARSIGTLLTADGPISVLEPSCGNALAAAACLQAVEADGAIYGVELRTDAAKEARKTSGVKAVINADFLTGVIISNNAFNLIFANPPYGLTEDGRSRLETEFLKRLRQYACKDGVLVWIIPAQCLSDKRHVKELLTCWKVEREFRFRGGEYERFHQLVLILRKRDKKAEVTDDEVAAFSACDVSSLPELPAVFEGEKVMIPACAKDVSVFKTKEFDVNEAVGFLSRFDTTSLYNISEKRVSARQEIHPPMEISADSMYLSLVSGLGQGLAGETGHVHLQRGNVKKITEETEEEAGERKVTVRKRTMARAYLTIIEPTGIRRLE